MRSLVILASSPVLMNAGTSLCFLSACVVLPVEDNARLDLRCGARHGASAPVGWRDRLLLLPPAVEGDDVHTTHGVASGTPSFMRIFDVATDVARHGGRRRGANVAVLDVSHPDVVEFVTAKSTPGTLQNCQPADFVDARGGAVHLHVRVACIGQGHHGVSTRQPSRPGAAHRCSRRHLGIRQRG
jgi:ribonucleoside-diphosphate reductase alpha chain